MGVSMALYGNAARRTPQVFRVHKTDHTLLLIYMFVKGRHCRGRMVVGFTTTYAINVNHH